MDTEYQYIYMGPADYIKTRGTYAKEGFVVHFISGSFFCYRSRCPHKPEEGDLSYGTFCPVKMTVRCESHRFEFCVKSGKNIKEGLRKYGDLELLSVYEEDGNLYIKVNENEKINLSN